MTPPDTSLFDQIRLVVKKIPKGKVLTYGDVARIVGITDSRKVGWALHGNQDEEIPCHRVVKKNGFIAANYSLGGGAEQKRRLEVEGVKFISEMQVDMTKCHFAS